MEDFDKLYRTYYRQVYLYLLDLCKEPDLAEEPYKEVFWMRTFGELSFKEIGEIHGKTESWARVTFYRAKQKIKEALG